MSPRQGRQKCCNCPSHLLIGVSWHGSFEIKPFQVFIDGPFGAPASNIFRAQHAVLIATGIGVTPFSSILQSIMLRFWANKKTCPNCSHKWTDKGRKEFKRVCICKMCVMVVLTYGLTRLF